MYNVINECFRDKAHLIDGYHKGLLISKPDDIHDIETRVVLALNSPFNNGSKDNPTDVVGTIVEYSLCRYYDVNWDNGKKNSYLIEDKDLIEVPKNFVEKDSKKCKCCGNEKEFSQFEKSDNSEDGYFPYCKPCVDGFKTWHEDEWKRYFNEKRNCRSI